MFGPSGPHNFGEDYPERTLPVSSWAWTLEPTFASRCAASSRASEPPSDGGPRPCRPSSRSPGPRRPPRSPQRDPTRGSRRTLAISVLDALPWRHGAQGSGDHHHRYSRAPCRVRRQRRARSLRSGVRAARAMDGGAARRRRERARGEGARGRASRVTNPDGAQGAWREGAGADGVGLLAAAARAGGEDRRLRGSVLSGGPGATPLLNVNYIPSRTTITSPRVDPRSP